MLKNWSEFKRWFLAGLIWRLQRAERTEAEPIPKLSATQELFCEWNAEQLGISLEESRARYIASWQAIAQGHGGHQFRDFCDLSYRIYGVFHDDSAREVFASYQFHGPMHFLRMLSYNEPPWTDDHPAVQHCAGLAEVSIFDFGCGLAHVSRSLALKLRDRGKKVTLTLADIPTTRKPFLLWLCAKTGIPATFLDCTPEAPIPPLVPSDVLVATEVLEHLHDPMPYLSAFHAALRPGGFLRTNVSDHPAEYGHVSTNLEPVRQQLRDWGYQEMQANRIFQKSSA